MEGVITMDKEFGEDNKKKNKDKEKNYMLMGMCFGLLAGAAGMVLCSAFGLVEFGGYCVGIGLCIGMVIGMNIKKK